MSERTNVNLSLTFAGLYFRSVTATPKLWAPHQPTFEQIAKPLFIPEVCFHQSHQSAEASLFNGHVHKDKFAIV